VGTAKALGFATSNIGLLTDIMRARAAISLARERQVDPIAAAIQEVQRSRYVSTR